MTAKQPQPSRRTFIRVSATAGGGMLLGFSLWGCKSKDDGKTSGKVVAQRKPKPTPVQGGEPADVTAYIRIEPDNTIHVSVPEAEMGQGVLTSVPMIIADEMGARWENVRSAMAPLNPKTFGRQSTGGSSSIRKGYETFRQAGATAREMLVAAAAAQWKVKPGQCSVKDGAVTSGKQRLTFGQLAAAAAKLPPPKSPKLKAKSELRYIGKSMKRLDTPAKVDGSAKYGIDVTVPGMLVAQVAHCPIFGGKLAKVDATKAKKVPGVRHVVEIPTGVAVVADHFWAAQKGRDALDIKWDDGGHGKLDDAKILALCKQHVGKGKEAHKSGDVNKALAGARTKLTATYHVPFLAHAPMEPLNCTAHVEADKCTVWVSTQSPSWTAMIATKVTGLPADKIVVNSMMLGGGFGRRSQTDFIADALHISKKLKKPIKVVWRREDGVQGGFYRPTAYNEFRAGLDADGWPVAWEHKIASPSILKAAFGHLRGGLDGTATEGAANLPYDIPNMYVSWANPPLPVTLWFWRSVGSSQNAYITECFLDELAKAGGKDPVALRRKLLAKKPRHLRVLDKAVEAAGWGKPLPKGHAHGVAVHGSFGSFVAEVAEVSIEKGNVRVHKVTCAVDCGDVINPDTVKAQMESGIVYGLTAALYGQVAIKNGRAVQSNFHDYKMLRIAQMPKVDVHIVTRGDPLGGVGEPGTPPIAPAVCNAVFALTGKPVRTLPIELG